MEKKNFVITRNINGTTPLTYVWNVRIVVRFCSTRKFIPFARERMNREKSHD
jgi:hypothetical protein